MRVPRFENNPLVRDHALAINVPLSNEHPVENWGTDLKLMSIQM